MPAREANPPDPFTGHTISKDGVREHDAYAANLVRDTNPDETARYLKNVITWSGDQGRGDVADLLGRFAKVDAAGGGGILREAINKVGGNGMVDAKGSMDARTFEAYRQLVDNPETRNRLLDAIANHFDTVGERERANHHRPRT